DLTTGVIRSLADAPTGRGGSWSSAGTIVFAPTANGGMSVVPATGGEARAVTRLHPREAAHLFPSFVADGTHFVYLAGGPNAGIFVGSTNGDEPKLLLRHDRVPIYAPRRLMVWRDGTLESHQFDESKLRLTGSPTSVAERVSRVGVRPLVSVGGSVMTYVRGDIDHTQLVWVDRQGKEIGSLAPPGLFYTPRLSHDGWRLAVDISV